MHLHYNRGIVMEKIIQNFTFLTAINKQTINHKDTRERIGFLSISYCKAFRDMGIVTQKYYMEFIDKVDSFIYYGV